MVYSRAVHILLPNYYNNYINQEKENIKCVVEQRNSKRENSTFWTTYSGLQSVYDSFARFVSSIMMKQIQIVRV